jgi:GTPase SAR1 family protein
VNDSIYVLTLQLENFPGKDIFFNCWEAAGQRCFESIHSSLFSGAQAVIIVFHATGKETNQHSMSGTHSWYGSAVVICHFSELV